MSKSIITDAYCLLAFGIIFQTIRDYQAVGNFDFLLKKREALKIKTIGKKPTRRYDNFKELTMLEKDIAAKRECLKFLSSPTAMFYFDMLDIQQKWVIDNIDSIDIEYHGLNLGYNQSGIARRG